MKALDKVYMGIVIVSIFIFGFGRVFNLFMYIGFASAIVGIISWIIKPRRNINE